MIHPMFCFPLAAAVLAASTLPILVITGLCVYTCVIALSADKRRSRRALIVLRDLLTTLGRLCRRGRR